MPGPGRFTPSQDLQIEAIKRSVKARGGSAEKAAHMAYGHVQNLKKKKPKEKWHDAMKRTLPGK